MNKKFNSLRYSSKFEENGVDNIRLGQVLKFIGSEKKVLDVGCGDGFIMKKIRKNGNNVEGIEVSTPAVIRARKSGFKVYDLSLSQPWAKNIKSKFDIVFAGEIIEHIFDTDSFLQNIHGVLEEKGKLVITTPNIASLGRRILLLMGKNPLIEITAIKTDAGHIRYFTRDSLISLLKKNRFKILEIKSSVVNVNLNGTVYSGLLAKLFPTLGNNIIIYAEKI